MNKIVTGANGEPNGSYFYPKRTLADLKLTSNCGNCAHFCAALVIQYEQNGNNSTNPLYNFYIGMLILLLKLF